MVNGGWKKGLYYCKIIRYKKTVIVHQAVKIPPFVPHTVVITMVIFFVPTVKVPLLGTT